MRIRGIVRVATLEENPPGSDRIEMLIKVQGVRPEQPRLLVVPYELLLGDEALDAELPGIDGSLFQPLGQDSQTGAEAVDSGDMPRAGR